eukprot:g1693.t1
MSLAASTRKEEQDLFFALAVSSQEPKLALQIASDQAKRLQEQETPKPHRSLNPSSKAKLALQIALDEALAKRLQEQETPSPHRSLNPSFEEAKLARQVAEDQALAESLQEQETPLAHQIAEDQALAERLEEQEGQQEQENKQDNQQLLEFSADFKFSRKDLQTVGIKELDSSGAQRKKGGTSEDFDRRSAKSIGLTFNEDGTVDRRCKAVRSGEVLVTQDGAVDKRSTAVKNGTLVYEKHASHIESYESTNAVLQAMGTKLTKEQVEKLAGHINDPDNLSLKFPCKNTTYTRQGEKDYDNDRVYDKEIQEAYYNGQPLSAKASERAHKQIQQLLQCKGQGFDDYIKDAREFYSSLTDNNGKKICRKNAKMTEPLGKPMATRSQDQSLDLSSQDSKGLLKKDGTPDMRYKANRVLESSDSTPSRPLKKDGTPDMRYSANKSPNSSSSSTSYSSPSTSSWAPNGPLKADGTPDMRYSANRPPSYTDTYSSPSYTSTSYSSPSTSSWAPSGPSKADGTPDMRYSANRSPSYSSPSYTDTSYSSPSSYSSYSSPSYSSSDSYSSSSDSSWAPSGPLKADGTPDMRYSANRR